MLFRLERPLAAVQVAAEPVAALNPAQRREFEEAGRRARTIRRAAGVAAFNGWSMAVLAVCSTPFAFGSPAGLVIAIGLGLVAWNEFRGRRRLLEFDSEAAAILGWNQIALLAIISGYCLWQTLSALAGGGPFAAEIAANPELRELLGSGEDFDQLFRLLVVVFYGVVLALSLVFQGANAWYYFSRRRVVDAYLRSTPAWVLDLQRLAGRA